MRSPAAFCVTAALLASCSRSDRSRPARDEVVADQHAAALEAAAPQLAAMQEESTRVMSEALVKAWLATIRKGQREVAERELVAAAIRVDAACGNTPSCAVSRVEEILRGNPRSLRYTPVVRGQRTWVNVTAGEFEDTRVASAEILVTVDFSDDGEISFEELGVSLVTR